MNLTRFSSQDLKEELSRRDEEKRVANKPNPLMKPDLRALKHIVSEYIESIHDGTYHEDSDVDHYICEAAVVALYGKNVFNWIRENT